MDHQTRDLYLATQPDLVGGMSLFTPDEGVDSPEPVCLVCGGAFNVERGISEPRSFTEAMRSSASGVKIKHKPFDRHWCVYASQNWHRQATEILKEASKTASKNLRGMLLEEAKGIVETRQATITPWNSKTFGPMD